LTEYIIRLSWSPLFSEPFHHELAVLRERRLDAMQRTVVPIASCNRAELERDGPCVQGLRSRRGQRLRQRKVCPPSTTFFVASESTPRRRSS
jgi:hypothetical protein